MIKQIGPWRLVAVFLLFLFADAKLAGAQNYYGDNVSYQQFYDELSPYGEWINDPQNGYVWVPSAGDDFRPYYTNGYWANTEYGNTWVSRYNWGWAPFHYGRWTYSNYYGWVWIPGNVWGPAWVSWRSGGGSYGWAPLGPGISINFSFGNSYYVPDFWWTFTPQQYILSPRFHNHCYGPSYNSNYIHQTTIINNTYVYNNNTYVTGPRRNDMERAIGRPVKQMSIENGNRPDRSQLHGDRLSMYRPNISENRGRTPERPRQFRVAEQPINASTSTVPTNDQSVIRQSRDRDQVIPQDRGQATMDRPSFENREVRQPRAVPRQEQIQLQQNDRQPGRVVEAPRPQRDWNNGNRFPERVQQPQQRIEREPMIRSMESPRVRQAEVQPQRIERPAFEQRQPVMQQRAESPRMESPRAMPQREAPARNVTSERPAGGGRRLEVR